MKPMARTALLVAMVIARPSRAWLIAGICTLASVAGGAFGYFIGWGLFEEVGRPVLELFA